MFYSDNMATISTLFKTTLRAPSSLLSGKASPRPVAPSCYSLFRALCWVAVLV